MRSIYLGIVFLSIVVILTGVGNILQSLRLNELENKVRCLEQGKQGRIYVGYNFCVLCE